MKFSVFQRKGSIRSGRPSMKFGNAWQKQDDTSRIFRTRAPCLFNPSSKTSQKATARLNMSRISSIHWRNRSRRSRKYLHLPMNSRLLPRHCWKKPANSKRINAIGQEGRAALGLSPGLSQELLLEILLELLLEISTVNSPELSPPYRQTPC